MSFFSFDEHHVIKMYEPNSHTIVFIVHKWVTQCVIVQGKGRVKYLIVLDGASEKAEVRS